MVNKPIQRYKIIGVAPNRVVESKGSYTKPPADSHMYAWAKERACSFVIRYMPSKKGWRITDLRNVQAFNQPRFTIWKGAVRGTKYYPTEDAAIMVAMHMIGCDP